MAKSTHGKEADVVKISRLSILFLFYGTLHASTLLPTVLTIKGVKWRESSVFYGICAAIGLGLPMFTHGKITGSTTWIVGGSIPTVALLGVIALLPLPLSRRGKVAQKRRKGE